VAIYKNAVIRHGSATIRTDVAVDSADVSLSAPESVNWAGRLLPPNNTGLTVGQQYTLILPKFSPAKIVITEEPNRVDGVVLFRGVGPMPRSTSTARLQKQ
jgi:hypothetical protein